MTTHADLTDKIYECALLPELWPGVLDGIAEIAGARGGLLFAANSQILNWTSSGSIREIMARSAQTNMYTRSQRVQILVNANHLGFSREIDLVPPAGYDMKTDPFYRDVLFPAGLGFGAGTFVRLPTNDLLIVSVEAERARGPIEPSALAILDSLRPHIARSALLSARLQLERAKVASETLALLGLPAFVLDNAGKVLVANALGESLSEQIRWRTKDRLSLKDDSADILLRNAMSSLDTEAAGTVRSFATQRTEDRPGMIVHVIPIRGTARDLFVRCAAILVLTPVTMPAAPPADLLQSLFDLTPAEARVASGLIAGDTPDEIATRGKVSLNTVRTQVRGVLDKTGCRRQTEFVALVSSSSIDSRVV